MASAPRDANNWWQQQLTSMTYDNSSGWYSGSSGYGYSYSPNPYGEYRYTPPKTVFVTDTGTQVTPEPVVAVFEEKVPPKKDSEVVKWLKGRVTEITDMAWSPA